MPARADDRDTFSTVPVPPNVAWVVDNSSSMADLSCYESLVTIPSQICFRGSDIRAVPDSVSGVKICRSTFFDARTYDATATYWFDPGINTAKANAAGMRYRWDNEKIWSVAYLSSGPVETSIASYCSTTNFPNCWQRSRCVYSLQKYGYFAERAAASERADYDVCVGQGDPANLCTAADGAIENSNGRVTVSEARMIGNLIENYPPKYAVARKVIREINGVEYSTTAHVNVAATAAKQRLALFSYNGQWGASIEKDMLPACASAYDQSLLDSTRNGIVDAVDGLSLPSNTPLGETMDDIGCYFGAGDPAAPCTGGAYANSPSARNLGLKTNYAKSGNLAKPAPICKSCQRNFTIIVTDGFPYEDGRASADGGNDGTAYTLMSLTDAQQGTEVINGVSATGQPILPSVTKFLYLNDLDKSTTEVENVITYAVSFGLSDTTDASKCYGTLERAASNGGGKCFPAADYAQLKNALQSVLQAIDARNRAFTSPVVQTTRTQSQSAVNLAVFKPHASLPLWRGNLFSFSFWDERIDGVFSGGTPADDEIFVLDALNNPVSFDQEGNLLSKPYWDAALCLGGDLSGNKAALVPEDPFGLDVSNCRRYADENNAKARKLLTKVNPRVPGTPDLFGLGVKNAQAAILAPLMGITGTLSAAKVIKYIRGFDELDHMQTGDVTNAVDRSLSTFAQRDGWWKLGDINHSAPTEIVQPLEFYRVPGYGVAGGAYDKFRTDNKARQRVLIAGSNDGMVHAFKAGAVTTTNSEGLSVYDKGTGEELWGFVPPHILPSYGKMLDCPNDLPSKCTTKVPAAGSTVYQYRVDGTPMVRDAYMPDSVTNLATRGTTANLQRPSNSIYWKTLAVIGDRDGGTKFTALDLSDPANPKFLWEFPTAGVHLGTGSGKRNEAPARSWSEVLPNPAPIFPMKFKDTTSANPAAFYLRWVVALSGGFDRNNVSGRGFYLVDASTGELLWKWEHGMAGASRMVFSVAAPPVGVPALVPGASGPYVDTLVAVDVGGQVWKVDASAPAVLSPLAQWTAKRVFSAVDDTAVTTSNGDSRVTLGEYPYRPFFASASVSRNQSGKIYVYIGSGDRDLLANPNTQHLQGVSLDGAIKNYVCGNGGDYDASTKGNRFYAFRLDDMTGDPARPWREADLINVTAGNLGEFLTTPVVPANSPGWYVKLRAAEKVSAAANLFQGTLYFTTYTPTGACDTIASTAVSCDAPAGVGRLYAVGYQVPVGGVIQQVNGVPSPPSIGYDPMPKKGKASASILTASSQSPTPIGTRVGAKPSLVDRVLKMLLPANIHEGLRKLGSGH